MGATVKRQQETVLLLGCGYVGKAMIAPLIARGYAVMGTARSEQGLKAITQLGAEAIQFEGVQATAELTKALRRATHIITSVPPRDGADPVLSVLGTDLTALAPNLRYSAYLSATSVYGDRAGQWAYEDELLRPKLARGKSRIAAELAWLESGAHAHVFRLAGIYGPGRSPFNKIISGEARAVIKAGHVVNRIHRDDIVSALLASMDKPDPGQVYNVADGVPAPPQDVLDYAADLIGAERPKRVDHDAAQISDMARSFYTETKRINSDRLRRDLSWTPKFPDYKSGLRHVAKTEEVPLQGYALCGYILAPKKGRKAFDRALTEHIALSQAEAGCLEFTVTPHPERDGRYDVYERFVDKAAFDAHKARIEGTLWQSVSQKAQRHYTVNGAG